MTYRIAPSDGRFPNAIVENITDADNVWITLTAPDRDVSTTVDRAEFLAAVAAELDVIVIPRADLPEVTEDAAYPPGYLVVSGIEGIKFPPDADYRARALQDLALDEYVKANPPVEIEAACAWSDYRKDYGTSGSAEHQAFLAGFKAARKGDQAGVIR